MELVPFSIKLGDLIEYRFSYLHRVKSLQALMQGKSTASIFLGPLIYTIMYPFFTYVAAFRRGLCSENQIFYFNYDKKMTQI